MKKEPTLNTKKQGVHGLQALAFCIVTVNDEHKKSSLKESLFFFFLLLFFPVMVA